MKTFPKPQNVNGTELIEELAAVGIIVDKIFTLADGSVAFETDDEAKAAVVVAAHNGTTIAPELTVEEKLASVGLSIDDLKQVLGL